MGSILNFREDDLSGLENHFYGHLRDWHPFLQLFEPIQDDVDLLKYGSLSIGLSPIVLGNDQGRTTKMSEPALQLNGGS